jgi:hypothetical protein
MDGHSLLRWTELVLGVVIILVVLADVFLTVLYARVATGVPSHYLACWVWRAFRCLGALVPKHRDRMLSFGGPVILVALVFTWIMGLVLGAALVIQPMLGKSITATNGPTPTDFFTAMYMAGDSMSTVGTSDLAPRTPFSRLFFTTMSFLGLSIVTLTLTYFLEIYNALQRRNVFAFKLHLATGETGDAADLVAGLGPGGHFDTGYTELSEMQAEMASFKETHHFYSVLLYFRFKEPYYAVSRLALVNLDTVALIKSTLSDQWYGWLKESAAVNQLWRGSMHLMTFLTDSFLPGGIPDADEPDEQLQQRWRDRYRAALRRLRQADIHTIEDESAGEETYVNLRMRWDRFIRALADHMAYDIDVIDPAGANPAAAEERQDFHTRLRSAG